VDDLSFEKPSLRENNEMTTSFQECKALEAITYLYYIVICGECKGERLTKNKSRFKNPYQCVLCKIKKLSDTWHVGVKVK